MNHHDDLSADTCIDRLKAPQCFNTTDVLPQGANYTIERVMMEYSNLTGMEGLTCYDVTDKKGTELWLGIGDHGVTFFEKHNKQAPPISYRWGQIQDISFNDLKFKIKLVDRKAGDVKVLAQSLKINKEIMATCKSRHKNFRMPSAS